MQFRSSDPRFLAPDPNPENPHSVCWTTIRARITSHWDLHHITLRSACITPHWDLHASHHIEICMHHTTDIEICMHHIGICHASHYIKICMHHITLRYACITLHWDMHASHYIEICHRYNSAAWFPWANWETPMTMCMHRCNDFQWMIAGDSAPYLPGGELERITT